MGDSMTIMESIKQAMQKKVTNMSTQYFHSCTTHNQIKLLMYYMDLGLTIQQADSVIHTAWVYDYIDKQII
jgi:hypothetical protein